MDEKIEKALKGFILYGDDFTEEEITQWFKEEEEAYADLGAKNKKTYLYKYHEWNKQLGFNYLNRVRFSNALGLGSAYGDEFLPIIEKIDNLIIIEPSKAFTKEKKIKDTPCTYLKPLPSGEILLESDTIDLILCFGVLHHIPNVSRVFQELNRVLKKNGLFLVREPIVSMGDWRFKRKGLTKNERGIPLKIFRDIITKANFMILKETLCDFSVISKIAKLFGIIPYNNVLLTRLDLISSRFFFWNYDYHASSLLKKIRPASVFFLLSK